MRNSWPSHRNQTGVGFGWPASVTVVSQMMSSWRNRPAAAAWAGFSGSSIVTFLWSAPASPPGRRTSAPRTLCRFRLGPDPLEHLRDGLGRLRAGDPVPAVDDEEGDAGHAQRVGHLLVGLDGLGVLVTGQDGQRLVTVQAHVGRETGK